MKFTVDTIEVSTEERRWLKQSTELPPFSHEEIFDVCLMARDAFDEEFEREFNHFERLRQVHDDVYEAFFDVQYSYYDTVRLGRMIHNLSNVALGRYED